MSKYKKYLIPALAGIICGLLITDGVRRCNRQPIEVKIERDTVIITDTTIQYYPKPVEVTKTRTEYRWLPTAYHFRDLAEMMDSVKIPRDSASFSARDSVLVEVPIESKHYSSSEYDAWVSGYEPSLDSINVYQRTQMITEIRTISKQPNKWELDVVGGIDYGINSKQWLPYAGGELTINRHKRLQLGIEGGVKWRDKAIDPYAEIKAKFRLY